MADVSVDFGILEPLLEIIVDGFIRYFADERKVRYAHLLLLGAFKLGFLDLGLSPAAARGLHSTLVLLAARPFGHRLLLCEPMET